MCPLFFDITGQGLMTSVLCWTSEDRRHVVLAEQMECVLFAGQVSGDT